MNRLDRFGLTEDQLRSLVSEGLRNGGDWCDIYLEDTSYYDLMLRDGSVSAGGFHIDYGCGIRVLRGEKTGYAYAESTDYRELISAARAAGSIAAGSGRISGSNRLDHFRSDSGALSVKDHYPIEKDWREAEAKNSSPSSSGWKKVSRQGTRGRKKSPRCCLIQSARSLCSTHSANLPATVALWAASRFP